MRKMIFNTAVAVGMVSAVAGAWFYNAGRATQGTLITPAEASVALSIYDLTLLHGKNLPIENWEPAY